MVGGGCRGLDLARGLVADGHAVRAVTRTEARRAELEAAGCECWIGDPDRIGTLRYALDNVTLVLWLLGTASGSPEAVAALHGPRLRMMLEKTTDTTVRGVVYEAAGTVPADVLAGGAAEAEHARRTNEIPYALLEADPADRAAWLAAARAAIDGLLAARARRVAPAARARRSRYAREHLNPDRDHHLSRREAPVADYAKDVLVDTQWVEEHLDDDSIRIVEVDENPALYAEAHIPGAIGFDWKKDLQDPVKRDFLGPEAFGELFGSRGISNDHTIVLYGDRNNWFAAYTYWYLKYYGHDAVKLLNGPREKWIAEGRPTTTDVPSPSAATFTAQPGDDAIRAKRDEVLDGARRATARSSSTSARRRSSPAS